MKKVLKFKFEDKEGFLSVVEFGEVYYSLVQKQTPKVEHILKTERLLISYELKIPHFQDVFVRVSFDKDLIEKVFHQLALENNLYFKELDDSLCVLEIKKDIC